MVAAAFGGTGWVLEWFGLVPGYVIRGRIWQLATYLVLHDPGSPFHLIFNMLMLYMFGGELERHWGTRGFYRYVLVTGVGAGVFATALGVAAGQAAGVTIGASGAVFGLLMAFGLIFAHRTILFMMIFPMKAWAMAAIMFVLTLFYTMTQPGRPVSHIAHLGGAVVGLAYLKRVWRFGEIYRELRWKLRRRRFKVMERDDDFDRWVN
jgi:membrane associated rhomboid family serine protease